MRAYARKFGEDEEKWGVTGLLHDMDYEKHPTPAEHPMVGVAELEKRGYPEDVLHAIKGHADYLDVPRDTLMSKTLYAVDELSGFIVAVALMRPERLEGMKAKSVRKKMKQKSFAAAVNRDDIVRGAEELGVDLNEHIEFVAAALKESRRSGSRAEGRLRARALCYDGCGGEERSSALARVMVVFGGRSGEHEVSLASARAIMDALGGRHEVVPVGITRGGGLDLLRRSHARAGIQEQGYDRGRRRQRHRPPGEERAEDTGGARLRGRGLPCPARALWGGRHDPGHARARGRPLRRERGAGQRGRDGQADDEEDLRLPRPPAGRVARPHPQRVGRGRGRLGPARRGLPSDFRASSSPRTSAPASASARPRTLWC